MCFTAKGKKRGSNNSGGNERVGKERVKEASEKGRKRRKIARKEDKKKCKSHLHILDRFTCLENTVRVALRLLYNLSILPIPVHCIIHPDASIAAISALSAMSNALLPSASVKVLSAP